MEVSPSGVTEAHIERAVLMEAIVQNQAGISLLQWLVKITGFNRPTMNMEDAARRDVWLTIRQFIPVEKLGEIEHAELKRQQQQVMELLDVREVNKDE